MSTDDGKRVAQEWADAMDRMREQRDALAQILSGLVGLARMRGAANLHEYKSLLADADALLSEVQR